MKNTIRKALSPLRGLGLTRFPIVRKLQSLLNPTFITVEGLKIYIDKTDESITGHIRKGNYESDTIKMFKEIIRPGFNILDIGANIGFHTLLAAKLTGSTGRVWAFEPTDRLFKILNKNITTSNLNTNITPCKVAVSDHNGKAKLFINEHSNCNNKLYNTGNDPYEEVALVTLDTYLDKETKIDFIKIDIEGAEALAFKGMMGILAKCKPIIYTEFVPRNIARYGTHAEDMLKELESLGYAFTDTLDETKSILDSKTLMLRYPENEQILATNILCRIKD